MFSLFVSAALASSAPQTLAQDISTELPKNQRAEFIILEDLERDHEAEITYALSVADSRSRVSTRARALYRSKNGEWLLVAVTPLARNVQFTSDSIVETPVKSGR